jgi:hypothetical protein
MGEHSSMGRLPTTSPISLVSERSRGRVKMRCARCGLKEASIVGRVFLANGEPKFPNGWETRKSLAGALLIRQE